MTYTPTGYTTPSPAPASAPNELPPALAPAAKRNGRMIAGSLALIVVCGLGVGWAVLQASARDPELAIVKPVAYGQQITAADLGVSKVASDPNLAPIPASQENQVIGRYADANLASGTLLVQGDLSANPIPGAGQTIAYVPISNTRLPSGSLLAGQKVNLVYAPSTDGSAPTTSTTGTSSTTPVIDGTVLSVASPTSDGTILITVVVSASDAATLAQWSATESVELTAVTG